MNKLIFIIVLVSFLLWPIKYFSENKNSSYKIHHIFESDYQARQLILRNINIYPNIPLARFFQNKLVIITNKYFDNFFDLLDPNYYFFSSHPREVIGGQNYTRLPLLNLLPIALFLISKNKYKKAFLSLFLATILVLSFFTNHYLFDFILWPFFVIAISLGSTELIKKNKFFSLLFFVALICESIYEIMRLIK